MKALLFTGVAAAMLATSVTGYAAPAKPAPAPAAAPAPKPEMTYAEVKAAADALWARMDVNKDGRIDSADRDAELLKHFDKWDTNHDGMISKDEFLAHMHDHEGMGPEDHGMGPHGRGGPDGPPPPPPPGGPGHGPGPGPHPGGFAAMLVVGPALHEARKDGVITRADFDAAVKARFDKLDTDHNGKLSHEELHAAFREGRWAGPHWGNRGEWGHHRHHRHGEGRGPGGPHGPDGDMPPPPPVTH